MATTLLQRAETSTSSSVARDNERQYVINVLKENNYPKNFLHDCFRHPALTNCDSLAGDFAMKGFAIVPYIQGIAEPIMRILNNCGIKVALKPFQTLGHILAKPSGLKSALAEHVCQTSHKIVCQDSRIITTVVMVGPYSGKL